MRSKARYNRRVTSDVLQEQGDKAKGSRGGITAVQQSCQSTGRGGCTQPTVSHAEQPTREDFMVFSECQDIHIYVLCQDLFFFFYQSRIFIWLSSRGVHRYSAFEQSPRQNLNYILPEFSPKTAL